MRTTFAVVAYHRPDSLRELLTALRPRAGEDFEILVVNVEADPEVEDITSALGGRIVNVADNPGYAACVNRAILESQGDVVVFANDDVLCGHRMISALAETVLRGDADVAVPRVVDTRGETIRTCQAVPSLGSFLKEWVVLPDHPVSHIERLLHVEKWRMPSDRELVPAASAIVVAASRSLLRAEPLPEAYFMYFEESEWFWRLRKRGLRVLYCPDVTVCHYGGRGLVTVPKSRLQARNAVRFVRRTAGRAQAVVAYPMVITWQLRLFLVALIRRTVGHATPDTVVARREGLRAALEAWRELS